jgi:hypothetical protein
LLEPQLPAICPDRSCPLTAGFSSIRRLARNLPKLIGPRADRFFGYRSVCVRRWPGCGRGGRRSARTFGLIGVPLAAGALIGIFPAAAPITLPALML